MKAKIDKRELKFWLVDGISRLVVPGANR